MVQIWCDSRKPMPSKQMPVFNTRSSREQRGSKLVQLKAGKLISCPIVANSSKQMTATASANKICCKRWQITDQQESS
jgi:hypothetical protein